MTEAHLIELTVPADDIGSDIIAHAAASLAEVADSDSSSVGDVRARLGRLTAAAIDAGAVRIAVHFTVSPDDLRVRVDSLAADGSVILGHSADLSHDSETDAT